MRPSDHLDVYVATSMRKRHEFLAASRLTSEIFRHAELATLKLRWFDPTQAYCKDRVDKGLSEALMLRRALCTIYFAQESDTLGKDSELASTLAQGKTVIAFVPDGQEQFTSTPREDLWQYLPSDDVRYDAHEFLLEFLLGTPGVKNGRQVQAAKGNALRSELNLAGTHRGQIADGPGVAQGQPIHAT